MVLNFEFQYDDTTLYLKLLVLLLADDTVATDENDSKNLDINIEVS